jgi:FixJ family two-component response regulator
MRRGKEIFIADDDEGVRNVLFFALRQTGWRVKTFADGASLLAATLEKVPDCILLDVNMPKMSGIDALKQLRGQGYDGPTIMISGVGEIPIAVEAMRHGAVDFIQKPFRAPDIVGQVGKIVEERQGGADSDTNKILQRYPHRHKLTAREVDVLAQMVRGASTKEAALALRISPRTIEVHRSNIFEKTGARNSVDLVRLVLGAS